MGESIITNKRPLQLRKPIAAALIAVALCLIGAICPGAPPAGSAYADDAKEAIPSLSKRVRTDGGTWTEEASAQAGAHVHYRLAMTMAETVADDEAAAYVVYDKPAAAVTVDTASARAALFAANGTKKAGIEVAVSRKGAYVLFDLGDLKRLGDIAFGDVAVIEYDAVLSGEATPGNHDNTAHLVYDRGDGAEKTVDVMARIKVPARTPDAPTAAPKTGDVLPPWATGVLGGIAGAALAILAAAWVRRRRDGQ